MAVSSSRFIFIFSSVAIVSLLAVSSLNYFIDPAGIFFADGQLERAMANAVGDSRNLIISGNFDERKFVRYRINMIDPTNVNTIVTGSSRVLQLGGDEFDQGILNLGVSGATIEDHVALLHLAMAHFSPQTIILGLDPWILNETPGQQRWKTLETEFREAQLELLGTASTGSGSEIGHFAQLLNLQYTQESIRKFRDGIGQGELKTISSDAPLADRSLIRADGSRVYQSAFAKRTTKKSAREWAAYGLQNFSYSARNAEILEALIQKLTQRCEVVILLPPYHPMTFEVIREYTPAVLSVEEELNQLAARQGLTVVGSYDPSRCGCDEDDFFDGAHPRQSCISSLLSETPAIEPSDENSEDHNGR